MAGITSTGIVTKSYRDIITDTQKRLDDSDTGIVITDESNKTANNIANTFTLSLSELWEFGEQVYNSFNIYKAEGVSLDKLVAFKRLTRISAEYSTGKMELFAQGRVNVNPNTKFKDTRSRVVTSTETKTLGTSSLKSAEVSMSEVTTGIKYYIVLKGLEFSYTAVAGDTKEDVLQQISLLIDANPLITSSTASEVLSFSNDLNNNMSVIFHPSILLGKYSAMVNVKASETGALTFPQGVVTGLVTTLSNVTSVINPEAFVVGREQETDVQLRTRFLSTPAASENATVDSINRGVESVQGVESVLTINNPTAAVVDGIPEHSFEVIVSGGADQDIGDKILAKAAAGIQSFGNTTVTSLDLKGTPHAISFTRPEPMYIFFDVKYEAYEEEALPDDVETLIKDAIVTYGTGFKPNADIIPSRFSIPIYNNVSGIGELIVECGYSSVSTDLVPVAPYTEDRVVIDNRNVATIEASRITVTEMAIPI